jgi:hypothetical protein
MITKEIMCKHYWHQPKNTWCTFVTPKNRSQHEINLKFYTKYYKILCHTGQHAKECNTMIINIYSDNLSLLSPKNSIYLSIPVVYVIFMFLP